MVNFLGCALVCFIEVVRLARGQAKLQVRRRRRIGGDSRLSAGGYDVLVSARIHDQSIHYLGREIARRCAESLESTRQGKISLDQNVKMRVSQVVWGWTREDGRDESKREAGVSSQKHLRNHGSEGGARRAAETQVDLRCLAVQQLGSAAGYFRPRYSVHRPWAPYVRT